MFNFGLTEEKIERWQGEKNIKKLGKAAHAGKDNLRQKAATALLALADPEALRTTESLLNDPNEEIQMIVAQGFRRLHHEPSTDAARSALALILRDQESLVAIGDKAHPYLVKILERPETESAAFAAEVLKQASWQPSNDADKTNFSLARQEFELIPAIGSRALPLLDNYCTQQHDSTIRRRAAMALIDICDSAAFSYLEKYAKDKDEEIASLATNKKEEMKREEFVEAQSRKWRSFFTSPERNCTEANATKFIHLAMEYLERGLYYEAYCTLAVADYIYEHLTGGYTIKEGIRMADLHTQREREIKVFGDFKLESILEQISEKIRGKKQAGTLASLLLSGTQKGDDLSTEHLKLKQILATTRVHDADLLEATIAFLKSHENDSRRAWRAIVHLPDKRLVPSLIDTFSLSDFVFDPIQSLIYLDEDAVPELLEALGKMDYKIRANAAFTLGIIGQENTKPSLTNTLKNETSPVAQVSLHFALARMGEEDGHIEFLFNQLKNKEQAVNRYAARCIHHLQKGVEAVRLLPFLNHPDEVVRIHVIGALADWEEPLPDEVIPPLVNRLFEEKDNDVSEKLAAVLSNLKGRAQVVELLLDRLPTAAATHKEKTVSILGNLGAKESIEALLALWSNANPQLKRSLIWSFGQLGAVQSFKYLSQTLRQNEDLRRVAAFALLMLSDTDREAALKELRDAQNNEARMALALLGDKDAISHIRSNLSPYVNIQQIFETLDAAAIVHHADLTKPLYSLLEYSNQEYYPVDRYVRHSAVQALAKTILTNQ